MSGVYIVSALLLLLTNIVLARMLSVAEFGAFSFAISLATVLTIPVSAGVPMLLTREIATYAQNGEWPACRGLIVASHMWVLLISSVMGLGMLTWWEMSSKVPGVQLLIAFLLVPFIGLNSIRNGILKGLGRPVLAELPTQVMQPAIMIVGYLALAVLSMASATNALWWYLAVVAVTFGAASVMLILVRPKSLIGLAGDVHDLPRWRKTIVPFMLMGATAVLSTQVAVFVSGILGEEEVVAYLRVAERGAMMVIMPFHVLSAIVGPHIVQAVKSRNIGVQKQVARHSARLMFFTALPVMVTILVGGTYIIKLLFGAPYDQFSYIPLVIIAVSQVAAMSFGHAGMFLTMSGRESLSLASQLIALLVSTSACLLLIGDYGAVGAAIGVAAGVVTSTTISVALVRYHFGFIPGIF